MLNKIDIALLALLILSTIIYIVSHSNSNIEKQQDIEKQKIEKVEVIKEPKETVETTEIEQKQKNKQSELSKQITDSDAIEVQYPKKRIDLTDDEFDLLSRLIYAEARGESFEGKVAVAEVVLNRVENNQFPNTITEVIYQKNQFSPVINGSINNNSNAECRKAVKTAIEGSNFTNGALFFYNHTIITKTWLDTRQTATIIGNHTFKY